jgi:hypothetical protein
MPAARDVIRSLVLLAFAAHLLGAGTVAAQTLTVRTLPADAKVGYLSHVRENVVSLDGKQTRLAPGAQIRGANNLIVLPTALPPDSLVKYRLNASGELARAWILTAEEAKHERPDRGPDAGRPFSEILPPHASPPQPEERRKP